MKNHLFAVVALACLALAPAVSHADFVSPPVLLSDLIAGGGPNGDGTVIVGDKIFSNFSYNATGDMPAATGVNVIGGTDIFGNLGIRFQGGFHSNPGDTSDALIGYKVTIAPATEAHIHITDAHIYANPSILGGTGALTITEQFAEAPANQLNTFDIVPGSLQTTDATFFVGDGFRSLTVTKDILAVGGTGLVTLSFVDQTFSQTATPEPSSMLLLASGTALIGFVARRRRNAKKA